MMEKETRAVEVEVLPPEPTRFERDEQLIRFVAQLMDSMFVIPGTNIRFGIDPLLGLVPGIGDAIDAFVSSFLIVQSARCGVPKIVLIRMAANVLINAIGGALPVAGDAFSFWFKSNLMNYELLRRHASTRKASTAGDWLFVGGLVLVILATFALTITGLIVAVRWIFQR